MRIKEYCAGVRAGVPVCLGYLSVSFGFGAMAVSQGLDLWQAVFFSLTNLAGAGQFAGLTVIAAGAVVAELILTQLVINSRYALMSLALGQRLGQDVGPGPRLIAAYFNTDEVFAIAMARREKLTVSFLAGAGCIAALGWLSGTAMGAIASTLLPESFRIALGTMLYGMFVAIVVPQARQENPMAICLMIALVLSCLFAWLPLLREISEGLAIVICTVIAAAVCACLFPIPDEEAAQ